MTINLICRWIGHRWDVRHAEVRKRHYTVWCERCNEHTPVCDVFDGKPIGPRSLA